jgi:hypothetical protein
MQPLVSCTFGSLMFLCFAQVSLTMSKSNSHGVIARSVCCPWIFLPYCSFLERFSLRSLGSRYYASPRHLQRSTLSPTSNVVMKTHHLRSHWGSGIKSQLLCFSSFVYLRDYHMLSLHLHILLLSAMYILGLIVFPPT